MDHGAGIWTRDEGAWVPLPSLGRRFARTLFRHPLRASFLKARMQIWTDLAASLQGSDSQLELKEAIVFCIRPQGGGALVGSRYNLNGFKPGLRHSWSLVTTTDRTRGQRRSAQHGIVSKVVVSQRQIMSRRHLWLWPDGPHLSSTRGIEPREPASHEAGRELLTGSPEAVRQAGFVFAGISSVDPLEWLV